MTRNGLFISESVTEGHPDKVADQISDAVAGFPGLPDPWRRWPTALEVAFTLTLGTCVYGALYEEYERQTLADAARTVFDPRNREIFVHYRLHTVGLVSALGWYAAWPLLRRGAPSGVVPRQAMQGAAPWESEADDTLLELWNRPRGAWGCGRTLMLRVGGRTPGEAAANWVRAAKPLRRMYREVDGCAGGGTRGDRT